jgi:hypothetical protein
VVGADGVFEGVDEEPVVGVVVPEVVFDDEVHPAAPIAIAKATTATAVDRLVLNRLEACFTLPPIFLADSSGNWYPNNAVPFGGSIVHSRGAPSNPPSTTKLTPVIRPSPGGPRSDRPPSATGLSQPSSAQHEHPGLCCRWAQSLVLRRPRGATVAPGCTVSRQRRWSALPVNASSLVDDPSKRR